MSQQSIRRSSLLLGGAIALFVLNLTSVPAKQGQHSAQFLPPITALSLERSYCYGSCPAYKATLRADGSIEYIGRAFVKYKGTYVCTADARSKRQFQRLAELADLLHLNQLQAHYVEPISDVPYETAGVKRGGAWHTVESCCDKEPTSAWGFETAVDAALIETWNRGKWKQTAKAER